jgi:FKBP-type peptidyl-prolyl cis-trans isomerase
MRKILFLSLFFITLVSCEEDVVDTTAVDDQIIREYLSKAHIDAKKHSSGLYYVIEKEGEGSHPSIYDNIDVLCLGYFVDSTVFQSNKQSIKGQLKSFIPGWQYGIPLFKKGGRGKLFIPRKLGYGTNSQVMIFDIELRNVWQ